MMIVDDGDGSKICTHTHMGAQKAMGKMKLKLRKNLPFFLYFLVLYYNKY